MWPTRKSAKSEHQYIDIYHTYWEMPTWYCRVNCVCSKKYDLKWGLEQVHDVWTKSFRPDLVQVPSDDEPEAVEEESAGKEPLHHRKTILNGRWGFSMRQILGPHRNMHQTQYMLINWTSGSKKPQFLIHQMTTSARQASSNTGTVRPQSTQI